MGQNGDVVHPPWPLQPAGADLERDTMTGPYGIELPAVEPLPPFSRHQDVVIWPLEPVDAG